MQVAVVGAGAAGLCAARHITTANSGFTCVIFEQTDRIGGTWVYSESSGKDKYGLPIGSAMYKNLRTNLAKENMEFPGFPFVNSKSFVTAAEVLQYLEDYSNYYELKKYIKFLCHVICIAPKKNRWEITYLDISSKEDFVKVFDAVVICNGHYSEPDTQDFPKTTEFKGEVNHSYTYRTPEPYTGKTVLVCGGGPSGIDITYDLSKFAYKVYFSHKCNFNMKEFHDNVVQVPTVKEVKKDCVIYEDGTVSEHIDFILLCTGYKYTFPFISQECGITVEEDKFVYPLYKHIINVNNPSMAFIGLLFRTFLFPMFDIQIRFFLKSLTKEITLPNKHQMLKEISTEILQNKEKFVPVRKYFQIGDRMKSYLEELAEIAHLEHLPLVVYKIYNLTFRLRKTHLASYRDAVFEVLNNNDFKMNGLSLMEKESK